MARKKDSAENWWAGRWNGVLDSFGWQNRLARGRAYARRGMVLPLDISSGELKARVSGSRPTPYTVKIKFATLTARDWDTVFEIMSSRASYSALFLAGEMPRNIEDAFEEASVSLFPGAREINMQCSCPDWALPCKHIAAVFYVLGERFAADPFLLFEIRGRSGDAVIKELRERRSIIAAGHPERGEGDKTPPAPAVPGPEAGPQLATNPDRFWTCGEGLGSFELHMSPPEVNGLLLKIAGPHPLLKKGNAFAGLVEECCAGVGRKALEAAYSPESEEDP